MMQANPNSPAEISGENAAKLLKANLANLIKKVASGKVLTAAERALISQHLQEPAAVNPGAPIQIVDSKSKLAAALGKSKQMLAYHLTRAGNPGTVDGTRYSVTAWRQYFTGKGISVAGHKPTANGVDLVSLKAKQLLLQNQKLEAQIAIAKGERVPSADVEKWGGEVGSAIRKLVLQLHNLAPTLAGCSVADAEKILIQHAEEILSQLDLLKRRMSGNVPLPWCSLKHPQSNTPQRVPGERPSEGNP
jgi:hypothetical protein